MRFNIIGANAESGDDVDVMLEAESREAVEQLAHEKGILVATINPLEGDGGEENPSEGTGIAMVVDDGPTESHVGAAVGTSHAPPAPKHDEHKHGLITMSANSPSEKAHTSDGTVPQGHHQEAEMEYHLMMNQSLYLLETAVNKYIRDGWEPQGGLTIGMSNNAAQYFQALIRRRKPGQKPLEAPQMKAPD